MPSSFKVDGKWLTYFTRDLYWNKNKSFKDIVYFLKDSGIDCSLSECIDILYYKKKLIGVNSLHLENEAKRVKKIPISDETSKQLFSEVNGSFVLGIIKVEENPYSVEIQIWT